MNEVPRRLWIQWSRETIVGWDTQEGPCNESEYVLVDTLPVAPEPDWDNAPDWAAWWVMDVHSVGFWYELEPYICARKWENTAGRIVWDGKDEDLPVGVDWRTTKRERREAK